MASEHRAHYCHPEFGCDCLPLKEFAEWILALDDVDGPGALERREVTLTKIIGRARDALGENDELSHADVRVQHERRM